MHRLSVCERSGQESILALVSGPFLWVVDGLSRAMYGCIHGGGGRGLPANVRGGLALC